MNAIVMWVERAFSICADSDRFRIALRPPLSFYSRKPVVVLPRLKKKKRKVADPEKGETSQESPDDHAHHDALDQHVEDVLSKRDKFRRVMQGVWSFCKTPLGVRSSSTSTGALALTLCCSFLPLYTGSSSVSRLDYSVLAKISHRCSLLGHRHCVLPCEVH